MTDAKYETLTPHNDIGYFVVARGDAYDTEFEVYRIIGTDAEGQIFYEKKNAVSSSETVETRGEAQVYLHGNVKWDGCSNFHFDEQDEVMLHFCGRRDATDVGVLLGRLYDEAERLQRAIKP